MPRDNCEPGYSTGTKGSSALDRGVAGRGQKLPGAADHELSATSATYVNYLLRCMACGVGRVIVLTDRCIILK